MPGLTSPNNKFSVGIGNRKLTKNLGFNVNYRWRRIRLVLFLWRVDSTCIRCSRCFGELPLTVTQVNTLKLAEPTLAETTTVQTLLDLCGPDVLRIDHI